MKYFSITLAILFLSSFSSDTQILEVQSSIKADIDYLTEFYKTRHQNPGLGYDGTYRIAYYPDVPEGRDAVRLIQYAFEKGFFFKIGLSVTTGLDDQTTWGGIHVKTSMDALSVKHGWDGVTADKVLVNVYSEFLKVFKKLPQDLILEKILKSLV